MQTVTLLCGVPGSGKTWVMSQLDDSYSVIHNDEHIGKTRAHLVAKVQQAAKGHAPVIVDCPFGERDFRSQLEQKGLNVRPVFIVEDPRIVKSRYERREGKPVAKSTMTRAETIINRADEWGSPRGTSEDILKLLKSKNAP